LNRKTEEIEINDERFGSMLKEAAYAASIFSRPCRRKFIDKKLREHGIITPDNVSSGYSSELVEKMCQSYSNGYRNFGRYGIEQARRLCDALVKLVGIVEKEKQEAL